jgi:uncharacterized membrane protein
MPSIFSKNSILFDVSVIVDVISGVGLYLVNVGLFAKPILTQHVEVEIVFVVVITSKLPCAYA